MVGDKKTVKLKLKTIIKNNLKYVILIEKTVQSTLTSN